jgi:hypothetical protein
MKRIITIAILLLPALFVSCDPNSENGLREVTGVVLNTDKVDIQVGESVTLTATVMPESLKMGVVWSVLDEEYASVSGGTVTGKAQGVTYVIATSADGSQKAACMVSVNPSISYSVSLKDEMGQLVTGIYGYPGMSTKLRVEASDEKAHTYTWSLEDSAAGSVSSDGIVTLGASASTNPAYVYDVQSYLKVVTEDGQGCKIPVRSSMLKGISVGTTYNPAGTPVIVQKDGNYDLAVMYEGLMGQEAIPADDCTLELSSTTYFSIQKVSGSYALATGSSTGVSTKLSVSPKGSSQKTEIAVLKIDKVYGITAQFAGSSSSTLSFTWTKGVSENDDIANPYTLYLYKDEDATSLEASFSIPAGDGCWKGRQPKFVFSGLTPGTDYWFKVVQTDSPADVDSPLIPASTDPFNIVMVSSDDASVGDIILAEDFGQMCWGADEITRAAGYDVALSSVAYNTDTQKSFTSRDAAVFVGTTGQYAQRSITAQTVAKKEEGFRLAKWAQGQYARIYIGPGYLFLSTKGYGTHLMTPELNSIPEGVTAKLKVTVHAAGVQENGEAVFAVQHGTSFYEISSGKQTNKASEGHPVDLTTNVKRIAFSGGITNLQEFEVEIDGVVSGDRIAFGPISEKAPSDNSNMMILSDMTIQIIDLE